jgi:type III pantothenate kinase
MLLAMDIGNTATSIGVFQGEELKARWTIATDVQNLVDEYAILLLNLLRSAELERGDVDEAILGSVVPSLTPVFQEVCRRYFSVTPLVVDLGVKTGVRIKYDSPRDVGADRVVDAVAAIKLYGPPLIIVDFGTATVFDAISKEGDYVGGAIAPGIGISSQALFERTAKLPRIELERPKTAIGKTTVTAMQSGIIFGYVGLIEGIVARMKVELEGNVRVIATGGWAPVIARETSVIDVVNLDLTLVGLHLIHEANRGERR